MPQVLLRGFGTTQCVDVGDVGGDACCQGHAVLCSAFPLPLNELRVSCGTSELQTCEQITTAVSGTCGEDSVVLDVSLRLVGGKGGFGSLLRGGQGGKVKKTTNFNACRNLNGRRIRHVKQEEEMEKWRKEQELKEMEEKGQKKGKEKEIVVFDESKLEEECELVSSMVSSAVKDVLNAAGPSVGEKRRAVGGPARPAKRRKALDPIFGDMSDSDDSEDGSDPDAEAEPAAVKKAEADVEEKAEEETASKEAEAASPSDSHPSTKDGPAEEGINLFRYQSATELEAVGLDGLKAECMRLGLLCGGSLQQRAERLFATKGVPRSDWDPALTKGKKSKGKGKQRGN